jgi:hypothetical protein
VQAPVNLAMPQAIAFPSQQTGSRAVPLAQAAAALGVALFSSASILQGRLVGVDLPPEITALFADIPEGARRALQLPRSAAGMTCALVGVSNPEHARDTFSLSRHPVSRPEEIAALFA